MVTPRTDSKACCKLSRSDVFVVSPGKTHLPIFLCGDLLFWRLSFRFKHLRCRLKLFQHNVKPPNLPPLLIKCHYLIDEGAWWYMAHGNIEFPGAVKWLITPGSVARLYYLIWHASIWDLILAECRSVCKSHPLSKMETFHSILHWTALRSFSHNEQPRHLKKWGGCRGVET